MRKIYLFTFMMLLFAHLKGQAQQITLHVESAGTLPGMIDESRFFYIYNLKLTGERILDLSGHWHKRIYKS